MPTSTLPSTSPIGTAAFLSMNRVTVSTPTARMPPTCRNACASTFPILEMFPAFAEHQSAPWDFLPGATVADERGEYQLRDRPERLAATYTLVATKPS